MSTKLEQKKQISGYRTTHNTCCNCAHCKIEMKLPAWMEKANSDPDRSGLSLYTIDRNGIEKTAKCTLHGFAVKKTAVCNSFEVKTQ